MKRFYGKGGIKIRKIIISILVTLLIFTGCSTDPLNEINTLEDESSIEDQIEEIEPIEITDTDLDLSIREGIWKNGVVASAHPIASKIGVRILEKGGNAIDAAVGVSFALGLLEPNASGPGGGGYMTVKMKNEKPVFIDYRCTSPLSADIEKYKELSKYERENSIYSLAVPGALDGWFRSHELYGVLDLEIILDDVIDIAEQGFEIDSNLETVFIDNYGKISSDDEAVNVFLKEEMPYSVGEIFKNKDYADFLKILIQEGRDSFYKGSISEKIIETVEEKNGWINKEDLKEYKSVVKNPLIGKYKEYEIITSAPSSSGGVAIIESLNMIEEFNLKGLNVESEERVDLLAEIFRLANIDRYTYVGDSDEIDDVINELTSKEYAFQRIKGYNKQTLMDVDINIINKESDSTTHFSIIDKDGNGVSVTNTLGYFFGSSTVVKDYGFFLNNQMYDFDINDWEMNDLEPSKRPRSSMSPTIITKENEIISILGSPGGNKIPFSIVQVIVNIIDLDMSLMDAINAPRLFIDIDENLILEEGFKLENIEKLKNKGFTISTVNDIGAVQGILKDINNEYQGVSDPRRGGKPCGY